jgi:short-subunit dehydrogenase
MLVTGASSGIGEASARLCASAGYRIVLAARRLERLERLAKEIQRAGGEALPVGVDLSSQEDIQRLMACALERYGRIDILVNNAGLGRLGWLENLDPVSDIEGQVRVNLHAVIYLTQAVLPGMIQRRSGHIINLASLAGIVGTPTYTIYAASKFAVRGFTEALRREVGVWGIRVSGIYPGGVANDFGSQAGAQRKSGITTPRLLRLSSEDVARAVLRVVRRPRRTVILPPAMRVAVWLNGALPGFVDWAVERWFVKPERDC